MEVNASWETNPIAHARFTVGDRVVGTATPGPGPSGWTFWLRPSIFEAMADEPLRPGSEDIGSVYLEAPLYVKALANDCAKAAGVILG